jgi:hypothetical protein
MKLHNANRIDTWKSLSQSQVHDIVGEAPVHFIEVGDSIVYNATDNIRKVVNIVPDAKMPDAYVNLHFEDGGAVTMPTKAKVTVPSSYKTNVVFHKNPELPDVYERATKQGGAPWDNLPIDRSNPEFGSDVSIFHEMTFSEANPHLNAPKGRSSHFNHGSTGHL